MKSQGASGQTREAERGVEKQDYVRLGKVSKAEEKQFLFIPSALHITKQEATAWSPPGKWLVAGQAQEIHVTGLPGRVTWTGREWKPGSQSGDTERI